VKCYAWSTSPLRRYVDLVNQRQLIALLSGERPPYGAKDAALFSIISAFDARHGAYQDFQQRMERLWCLRWMTQQGFGRTEAVVVREDVVRLARAPFYFRLPGMPALASGRRIVVDLSEHDEVDLSVQARFIEVSSAGEPDDTAIEPDEQDDSAPVAAGEPARAPAATDNAPPGEGR